jgi:hypothetical protein
MLQKFATLREDAELRDALQLLVELQSDSERPNATVVVDQAGLYRGLLTARLLFRRLHGLWHAGEGAEPVAVQLDDQKLLTLVRERSTDQVGAAVLPNLPHAAPETPVFELVRLVCAQRLEYLPILEGGRSLRSTKGFSARRRPSSYGCKARTGRAPRVSPQSLSSSFIRSENRSALRMALGLAVLKPRTQIWVVG